MHDAYKVVLNDASNIEAITSSLNYRSLDTANILNMFRARITCGS